MGKTAEIKIGRNRSADRQRRIRGNCRCFGAVLMILVMVMAGIGNTGKIFAVEGQLLEGEKEIQGRLQGRKWNTVTVSDHVNARAMSIDWEELEQILATRAEAEEGEWLMADNLKTLHHAFLEDQERIRLTSDIVTNLDWDHLEEGDFGWAIRAGTDITLDLHGHTLIYGGEGRGYYRLFYIRGTLRIIDSAGGGRITSSRGDIDSAICVDGGELVIEGGTIGALHGEEQKEGTNHGIVIKGNGTVRMEGGCIAGHGNGAENGGGIYVGSGILEVNGGRIEHNTGNSGGGIYGTEYSRIYIHGGTVCNNQAIGGGDRLSGWDFGGGGIFARGELLLTDGRIEDNRAVSGGGGIYYDTIEFDEDTRFMMSGGSVARNIAERGEGGGIYFGWNGRIIGGDILENHTNTRIDWGGGGIFIQTGVEVSILNAQIKENQADGFGGGVAGCPSGSIYAFTVDGAAVYGNSAKGITLTEREEEDGRTEDQKAKTDEVFMKEGFSDYYCEKTSTVFGNMLGGGDANWKGSSDGKPVTIHKNELVRSENRMGLDARPSREDQIKAAAYGDVLILGNTSRTHGGGIMSNGTLLLGSDVEMMDIWGTKIWEGDEGKEDSRPQTIIINLLANGELCGSKEVSETEGGWSWCFSDMPRENGKGKQIHYVMEEVPVSGYDTKVVEKGESFLVINSYAKPKEPASPSNGRSPHHGEDRGEEERLPEKPESSVPADRQGWITAEPIEGTAMGIDDFLSRMKARPIEDGNIPGMALPKTGDEDAGRKLLMILFGMAGFGTSIGAIGLKEGRGRA